ncbi:MAG: T9SS type A sorting domain-containing protein [Bacteroidales bacterium]|jgi:hypothetical protein
MKNFYFIILSISLLGNLVSKAQTTAIDFTLTDCNAVSRNLFSYLDQKDVIILVYEHQCSYCITGSKNIKTIIDGFYSGNSRIKIFYLDNGGNNCTSTSNWIINNNLLPGITFQYSNDFSSPYGIGMPIVVIACGASHKIYYKTKNTIPSIPDTNSIHNAIYNALLENPTVISEAKTIVDGISLYPNIIDSKVLKITFSNKINKTFKYEIIDITGKRIYSNLFVIDAGYNQKEIPIYSLNKGIYFLRIQNYESVLCKKFIIK